MLAAPVMLFYVPVLGLAISDKKIIPRKTE